MIVNNVYLPKDPKYNAIGSIKGILYQGGSAKANVVGQFSSERVQLASQPPSTYVGTVTSASGEKSTIVGTLIYRGDNMTNPGNAIFSAVPKFSAAVGSGLRQW